MLLIELFAEREGFEPPVPLGTAVFKTAVIDHSTTFPWCDLGGARTLDPMIKSHLLYQLSYQVSISGAKLHYLFILCNILRKNFSNISHTPPLDSTNTARWLLL